MKALEAIYEDGSIRFLTPKEKGTYEDSKVGIHHYPCPFLRMIFVNSGGYKALPHSNTSEEK